jgi:hypothetical protein
MKEETHPPLRKSDRILQIMRLSMRIGLAEAQRIMLEEEVEADRQLLTALQAADVLSDEPVALAPQERKAIEGPALTGRSLGAQKRWKNMTPEARGKHVRKMAQARWDKKGKKAKGAAAVKAYWAKMTPEERSVEMLRRLAMRGNKLHPRDKRSPKHAAWVKTMSDAQKKRYENMTVRERKQWQASLQAGREQRVNGAVQ